MQHGLVQRQLGYHPLKARILSCSRLNWRTSLVSSHLYCFFQRYSVCSVIPTCGNQLRHRYSQWLVCDG
jgi:hypothetical protein